MRLLVDMGLPVDMGLLVDMGPLGVASGPQAYTGVFPHRGHFLLDPHLQ